MELLLSSHAHALIKSLSLKAMSIVAPLFVVFLVSFYLAKRPLRLLYARSVVLSVHAQALSTSTSGGEDDNDTEQQHIERADNDANDDESLCSVRVMAYDCIAYKAATELPITRAATAAAAAAAATIVARTTSIIAANEEQGTSSGCQNSSQLVGSDSSKSDNFETVFI